MGTRGTRVLGLGKSLVPAYWTPCLPGSCPLGGCLQGTLCPTVDAWGWGAPSVGSLQRGGGSGAVEVAVPSVGGCPPPSMGAVLAGAMEETGRLPRSQLSVGLSGFTSSPGTLPMTGSCQGMAGGRTSSPLPHGATSTPQPLADPDCTTGVLSPGVGGAGAAAPGNPSFILVHLASPSACFPLGCPTPMRLGMVARGLGLPPCPPGDAGSPWGMASGACGSDAQSPLPAGCPCAPARRGPPRHGHRADAAGAPRGRR